MAGENAQEVGGIAIGLALETSGWSAGIERAKSELRGLQETAQNVTVAVRQPRAVRGSPALAATAVPEGSPRVTPSYSVTGRSVRQLRTDLNETLRTHAQQGEAVSVPVKLGRVPYAQIRNEISLGIGEVPIRVSVKGVTPATKNILQAMLSYSTGSTMGQAQATIERAGASRGIPRRAMGGHVGRYPTRVRGTPAEVPPIDTPVGERGLAYFSAYAKTRDYNFTRTLREAHRALSAEHISGGKQWYPAAGAYGRRIGKKYAPDLSEDKVIGVLAALSAGTAWKSNKTKFERVMKAHGQGEAFPYHVAAPGEKGLDAHKKAFDILTGRRSAEDAFSTSPKVGQFYRGLRGDLSTLTLDRWALRTATHGKLDKSGAGPIRTKIDTAWRKVAREFGLQPSESQAALWLLEKERSLAAGAKNFGGEIPDVAGMFEEGAFEEEDLKPIVRRAKRKHMGGRARRMRGGYARGGPAYRQVDAETFHRRIGMASQKFYKDPQGRSRRIGETVYTYPLDEYRDMRTYLDAAGQSGYAVKSDGDLVSVFNAGERGTGTGKRIVRSAIQRGATKLDAFDESGFLPGLYGKFGFRETGRDPWNPEYAPPGWRGDKPDVVYMMRMSKSQRLRKKAMGGATRRRWRKEQPWSTQTVRDSRGRLMSRFAMPDEGDPRYQQEARGRNLSEERDFLSLSRSAPQSAPLRSDIEGGFPGFRHRNVGGYCAAGSDVCPGGVSCPHRFTHASETGALGRLREITDERGTIRPGFEDEARSINLQVEKMRSGQKRTPSWIQRLHRAGGGDVAGMPYIVGEIGRELFVPNRMADVIPPDVFSQLPQRAGGGMVEVGGSGPEMWTPPEDGWIIPNRLMNKVPGRKEGTPREEVPADILKEYVEAGGNYADAFGGRGHQKFSKFVAQRLGAQQRQPKSIWDDPAVQSHFRRLGPGRTTAGMSYLNANPVTPPTPPPPSAAPGVGGFDPHAITKQATESFDDFMEHVKAGPRELTDEEIQLREGKLATAGIAGQTPNRGNLRSLFAGLFGEFGPGGGLERAKKMREFRIAEQDYGKAQVEHYRATKKAEKAETDLTAARDMGGLSADDQAKYTEKIATVQKSLVPITEHLAESEKTYESALKAVQPGVSAVVGNVANIATGILSYGVAIKAIDFAMSAALPAGQQFADQVLGFAPTFTRVTSTLADSAKQMGGNVTAAIAQASGAAGLGAAGYAQAQLLAPTVTAKGGAAAAVQASDIRRAAYGAAGGAAPEGLYGGYGGVLGSSLFAQQLGGGKGYAETLAGDIEQFGKLAHVGQGQGLVPPSSVLGPMTVAGGGIGLPPTQTPVDVAKQKAAFDAYTATIKDTNEAQQRGARYLGQTGKGLQLMTRETYDASTGLTHVNDQWDTLVQGFKDAGAQAGHTDEVNKIAANGVVLLDAQNRKAVESGRALTGFLTQAAQGQMLPTREEFIAQQRQQLAAQYQATDVGVQHQLGVTIPGQMGLQQIMNPFLRATTGLAKGFVPATANLKQAQSILDSIKGEGLAGIQQLRSDVATYLPQQLGAFDQGIAQMTTDSERVGYLQQKNADIQTTLSEAEYANNLRLMRRAASDAKGLATGAGGPGNLGVVQRQQFELSYASQGLSLAMNQRDINFQKAMAGFVVPGETGEMRAARKKDMEIRSNYAQQQQDISVKQHGLERTGFNIEAGRGVTDTEANLNLLQEQHKAVQDMTANTNEIDARTARLSNDFAKIDAIISGSAQNWSTTLNAGAQAAAMGLGDVAATMIAINKQLQDAYNITPSPNGAGAAQTLQQSQGTTVTANASGGMNLGQANLGKGTRHAAGTVGLTLGPQQAIFGEAEREAYAILRAPKMVSLASGGGGGSPNIQVIVTGNHVRDDRDIERIVREVEMRLVRLLGRNSSLVGLRSP